MHTYAYQGERAYVIAFTRIFLYDLLSSGPIVILLTITFIVSFLLLKSWTDGILMGLLAGIIVALLALYVTKNYLTEELAAGWLPVFSDRIWFGFLNGLVFGLVAALGGLMRQKMLSMKVGIELGVSHDEKIFYKCHKCGASFDSNPEFCSNCGRKLRRSSNK